MNPSIEQLLRNNYTDGVFHSHVSMLGTKGKFQFGSKSREELFEVYSKEIENNPDVLIGLAEKPQQYSPVLGDIDIKIRDITGDIGDTLYSDKHVKTVIEVYQSVIRNIVDECSDIDLTCVLLEKPMYRITKNDITYVKNGFHLHFPWVFLDKVDQEVHLIPRVKDALAEMKTFEDLGFENSGDIIDKACCKVPWLMYGSRKTDQQEPYKVTKIFDSNMNELTLENAFSKYIIKDDRNRLINIKGRVNYYLPRIFSIVAGERSTKELKHGLISPLKEKIKEANNNKREYTKSSVVDNIEVAKKLLPLLADYRAEDHNEWMDIGWILFNISEGHPDGLDLWLTFSERSDKFEETQCIYHWERMVKKDKGIGSLRYYASIDAPEEYKKFKYERVDVHLKEAICGSHNDIAKALYENHGDEFKCASITNKCWFQFINHKWESIENGVFLRKKISGEIVKKFADQYHALIDQLAKCDGDKGQEAMYNVRMKSIQKMMSSLKSAPFKNNVMRECEEVFYDKKFKEKLDTNPFLIAFKNGVYDLKLNIFRKGGPEDYISKCLPINYDETFTDDRQEVHNVHNFLEKIFPDKSIRKYFLDMSSDIFVGGNHQKVVLFWLGEGDNGKSVVQSIFEQMMGPLAIKFNTTVVTGKKVQSGSANPEMARAGGGVRWAVLEEPDGDEMINVGTLKHMSGNDTYYARDLFEKGKEGREITPMFKLIFIANKLPKLKHADTATWNRIRVVPFESTFCRSDNPAPLAFEEQLLQKRFPMDKEFSSKIPDMLEAFAWILLEWRKTVTTRNEPEKVLMATAIYRKQNDIYRQFIEECIVTDNSKVISLNDIYTQFKEWHRDSLPHQTLPIKNEIGDYFTKLWDEPISGKKWKGYRLRTVQDDIDCGNVMILGQDDLDNGDTNLPPI